MYRIENRESGIGEDTLELSVNVVQGGPLNCEGQGIPSEIQPGWASWNLFFQNKTGLYKVNISVTDSFGAVNSSIITLNIPC